jgi:hypothetical protein
LDQTIFKSFAKNNLPRADDQELFEKLFDMYCTEGKDAVTKHLKELIATTGE